MSNKDLNLTTRYLQDVQRSLRKNRQSPRLLIDAAKGLHLSEATRQKALRRRDLLSRLEDSGGCDPDKLSDLKLITNIIAST